MKTPDEIKKGLECCMDHDGTCEDCPYHSLRLRLTANPPPSKMDAEEVEE